MQNISVFQQRRPPPQHPSSSSTPDHSLPAVSLSLSLSGKTPEGMDEGERVQRGSRHAEVGEGVRGPSEHFWEQKPVVIEQHRFVFNDVLIDVNFIVHILHVCTTMINQLFVFHQHYGLVLLSPLTFDRSGCDIKAQLTNHTRDTMMSFADRSA